MVLLHLLYIMLLNCIIYLVLFLLFFVFSFRSTISFTFTFQIIFDLVLHLLFYLVFALLYLLSFLLLFFPRDLLSQKYRLENVSFFFSSKQTRKHVFFTLLLLMATCFKFYLIAVLICYLYFIYNISKSL